MKSNTHQPNSTKSYKYPSVYLAATGRSCTSSPRLEIDIDHPSGFDGSDDAESKRFYQADLSLLIIDFIPSLDNGHQEMDENGVHVRIKVRRPSGVSSLKVRGGLVFTTIPQEVAKTSGTVVKTGPFPIMMPHTWIILDCREELWKCLFLQLVGSLHLSCHHHKGYSKLPP